MENINDKQLISMMRQAAEKQCDDAIDKWWSGKYSNDQDEIRSNISLWKSKKQRISELCEMLKNNLPG